MFKNTFPALLLSLTAPAGVMASTLSGTLTADDSFVAFISTSDSLAGTQIASGDNWGLPQSFSNINLSSGQDYYLHIHAWDVYGLISAFLGKFDLSGNGFSFANHSTSLVTNATDWKVSTTGFGSNYLPSPFDYGANGVSPWFTMSGIDTTAHWLWTTQGSLGDAYFSTKITSTVPLPAAWAMMALGLPFIRLVSTRKKR